MKAGERRREKKLHVRHIPRYQAGFLMPKKVSMNKESITYASAALMIEYTQILREMFPGVLTLPMFMLAFNDTKFAYQGMNKRKLDPAEIRCGTMSCSPAAMLMGLLAEFGDQTAPIYHMQSVHELPDKRGWMYSQKESTPHCIIEAPDLPLPFMQMWAEHPERICRIEAKRTHRPRMMARVIRETRKFFGNRISIFGLSKTRREEIARHQNLINVYEGNDALFLAFLKSVFEGDKLRL